MFWSFTFLIFLESGVSPSILILFFSASELYPRISSIPSFSNVFLLMSGSKLILPLITMNLEILPQVLFLIVILNSLLTGRSLCRVFSFIRLGSSVSSLLHRFVDALNNLYRLRHQHLLFSLLPSRHWGQF